MSTARELGVEPERCLAVEDSGNGVSSAVAAGMLCIALAEGPSDDHRFDGAALVVPLFVGLFWGAPLVAREIEQGTHRLVWTQSVTRRRWIGTKLAVIGAGSIAGAAAFAALVTWWSAMFVRAGDTRFSPGVFDIRGIVPIAYVLFALALGVAAGTLIRKTLPAMAATLGGFAGSSGTT